MKFNQFFTFRYDGWLRDAPSTKASEGSTSSQSYFVVSVDVHVVHHYFWGGRR